MERPPIPSGNTAQRPTTMTSATGIRDSLPAIAVMVILSLLAASGAGIHGWTLAGAAVLLAWTGVMIGLLPGQTDNANTPAWQQIEWVYLAVLLFLSLMLIPLPLDATTLTGFQRFAENKVAATRLRQAAALDIIDLPALLFSTTRNRAGTLRVLAICIGGFSCALLSRRMPPPARHFLLRALVFGGAVLAWVGTVSLLYFPQGNTLWWRISIPHTLPGPAACFINQNHFGAFTAMLCPCAIVLAVDDMRKRLWPAAILMTLCAILLAVSVPVSEARGAILAGASGLIILPVFILARGHRRQAVGVLLSVLVLLAAVGFLFIPQKQDSMKELLRPTESANLQSRMQVWHECLVNWTHRPVVGHGPNSFHTSYPMWRHSSVSGHRTHAENMYVEVLFDSGVVGTGIALWALAALVARMRRTGASGACEPVVYYAVTGALVVAAVNALVEFAIYVPLYAFTLAALVGLVLPAPGPRRLPIAEVTGGILSLVVAFAAPVLYSRDSIRVIPRTEVNELARSIVWAPTSQHAWFYAGRQMMRSKEKPVRRLGERFMTQSMEYDPKNYRHWRKLGEMRERLKDRDGAREAYERAHALRDWVKVPAHLREDT